VQIVKTDDFHKDLAKLPADIRRAFARQEKIFLADYRDSRLHLKKLIVKKDVYRRFG
jgi:mRNA-degrading endonuclease RelE of RelBE toxin-antitoxin system